MKKRFSSWSRILKTNLSKYKWTKLILFFFIILFLFLDFISKYIAKENLASMNEDFLQINDTLYFSYKDNSGLSFGILANEITLSVVIQVGILIITSLAFGFGTKLEFCFAFFWITAAGLGNVIDRIDDGHVTDFISFDNVVYFNIADSYVIIGILFILYALFLMEDSDENELSKISTYRKKTQIR